MRNLIVLCLVTLPASVALGQDSSVPGRSQGSNRQIRLGVDAGYQVTRYSDGVWSGDTGVYHGPALSTEFFLLWKLGRRRNLAMGLRISVGYGWGTGTYEDGEGFSPAGGSGRPPVEYDLKAWYLQSNVIYVFSFNYFWVGAGMGGRYQKQEVATLGKDGRGDMEVVVAGGLDLPLGQHLSLTTKAEVNTNLFITSSVAGAAGLKLRF